MQRLSSKMRISRRSPSPARSLFLESAYGNSENTSQFFHPSSPINDETDTTLDRKTLREFNQDSKYERNLSFKTLYEFLVEAQLEHYHSIFAKELKIRNVEQLKYVTNLDLDEINMSKPEQRRLKKFFEKECPQTTLGKLKKRFSKTSYQNLNGTCKGVNGLANGKLQYKTASINSKYSSGSGGLSLSNSVFDDNSVASQGYGESLSNLNMAMDSFSMDGALIEVPGSFPKYQLIPGNQLELVNKLGSGNFSTAYQANWRTTPGRLLQVAVKVFQSDILLPYSDGNNNNPCSETSSSRSSSQDFIHSANNHEINEFLSSFNLISTIEHPDIVRMHGICIDNDSIKLVTELAPQGSLLDSLSDQSDFRFVFSIISLHKFCVQIVRGMAYLESRNLVHKNLTAANILLFSKDRVKISDFGILKALKVDKVDSYNLSNLNNSRLPIAWYPPEVILRSDFSSASDVWSFGVTMWEIFTYGFKPWAGLNGRQILEFIDVPKSTRLQQPDACPDALYDAVMRACWAHDPSARPTFSQMMTLLPRLCPERWRAHSDYVAMEDLNHLELPNHLIVSELENYYSDINQDNLKADECITDRFKINLKVGEIVYILNKKNSKYWRVITHHGRIGYVPPKFLRAFNSASNGASSNGSTTKENSDLQSQQTLFNKQNEIKTETKSNSFSRLRLSRREQSLPPDFSTNEKVAKRNGFKISANMISGPQSDVRHIGHVGCDGSVFGDVSVIEKAVRGQSFDKESIIDGNIFKSTTSIATEFEGPNQISNKSKMSTTVSSLTLKQCQPVSKPQLKPTMISGPTSNLRHLGHLGIDGESFGLDEKMKNIALSLTSEQPSIIPTIPVTKSTLSTNNQRGSNQTKLVNSSLRNSQPLKVEKNPPFIRAQSEIREMSSYVDDKPNSSSCNLGGSLMEEIFKSLDITSLESLSPLIHGDVQLGKVDKKNDQLPTGQEITNAQNSPQIPTSLSIDPVISTSNVILRDNSKEKSLSPLVSPSIEKDFILTKKPSNPVNQSSGLTTPSTTKRSNTLLSKVSKLWSSSNSSVNNASKLNSSSSSNNLNTSGSMSRKNSFSNVSQVKLVISEPIKIDAGSSEKFSSLEKLAEVSTLKRKDSVQSTSACTTIDMRPTKMKTSLTFNQSLNCDKIKEPIMSKTTSMMSCNNLDNGSLLEFGSRKLSNLSLSENASKETLVSKPAPVTGLRMVRGGEIPFRANTGTLTRKKFPTVDKAYSFTPCETRKDFSTPKNNLENGSEKDLIDTIDTAQRLTISDRGSCDGQSEISFSLKENFWGNDFMKFVQPALSPNRAFDVKTFDWL